MAKQKGEFCTTLSQFRHRPTHASSRIQKGAMGQLEICSVKESSMVGIVMNSMWILGSE